MFELLCDDCEKEATHFGPCPYAKDVNDEFIEATLCDECYDRRCDDI